MNERYRQEEACVSEKTSARSGNYDRAGFSGSAMSDRGRILKRFRECNWTPILVALLLALGIPWMNACDLDLGQCGDEVVQTIRGEECDQGESNSDTEPDACRTDCTLPSCGDGVVDTGEGCDDGNNTDGDGCRADCMLPFCGDGITDPGETCDDGNGESCDGCTTYCVYPTCGDGVHCPALGEDCDDGNSIGGDGCESDCTVTPAGTFEITRVLLTPH